MDEILKCPNCGADLQLVESEGLQVVPKADPATDAAKDPAPATDAAPEEKPADAAPAADPAADAAKEDPAA